jgi:hypothetical protein
MLFPVQLQENNTTKRQGIPELEKTDRLGGSKELCKIRTGWDLDHSS